MKKLLLSSLSLLYFGAAFGAQESGFNADEARDFLQARYDQVLQGQKAMIVTSEVFMPYQEYCALELQKQKAQAKAEKNRLKKQRRKQAKLAAQAKQNEEEQALRQAAAEAEKESVGEYTQYEQNIQRDRKLLKLKLHLQKQGYSSLEIERIIAEKHAEEGKRLEKEQKDALEAWQEGMKEYIKDESLIKVSNHLIEGFSWLIYCTEDERAFEQAESKIGGMLTVDTIFKFKGRSITDISRFFQSEVNRIADSDIVTRLQAAGVDAELCSKLDVLLAEMIVFE